MQSARALENIVMKNVAQVQPRKVQIIGPQQNKSKAPTKTKIDTKKCNLVKSSKKERHKCQNCPKSQNWDIVKSTKRKGAEEYEFLTQGSDMVCKVEIMGRKIEVPLDSGSEVSLLKSSVFKDLRTDSIWVRDSDFTVTQANGQKMELGSMAHLAIKVGVIKTWSKLYIVPDLERTMILSEDWLKKNQA